MAGCAPQATLDELQPVTGADFDRVSLQKQRTVHRMALEVHSNYAQRGTHRNCARRRLQRR
jgi:predicted outer membrane protein